MRFQHLFVFALGSAALLAGCGNESAAPAKAVKSTGNEEVTLKIAHATEAGGDFAASERLYKQAVSMAPGVVVPEIELGEFYHRHHKEHEAIAAFSEALRLDPKDTMVMRGLANIYINNGMPEKALALLGEAIALDGRNAFLYNTRGVAADMLGNYALAQQSYRTAIEFDPGNAMTFNANLSMSYILSGHYNSAIALLQPLLDMPDVTPTIRQNLAMAYGLKGDSARALKLSLKDLPMEQARENIKFYRMIANKPGGNKTAVSNVPLSVVNEIFPEESPADRVKSESLAKQPAAMPAAALKPISMRDMQPPASTLVSLPVAVKQLPAAEAKTPVATLATPAAEEPALSPAAQAEAVPSPEIKSLPADYDFRKKAGHAPSDSTMPAAPPSAGWVLPTPVLKPD